MIKENEKSEVTVYYIVTQGLMDTLQPVAGARII
jgi:hypothetical protein